METAYSLETCKSSGCRDFSDFCPLQHRQSYRFFLPIHPLNLYYYQYYECDNVKLQMCPNRSVISRLGYTPTCTDLTGSRWAQAQGGSSRQVPFLQTCQHVMCRSHVVVVNNITNQCVVLCRRKSRGLFLHSSTSPLNAIVSSDSTALSSRYLGEWEEVGGGIHEDNHSSMIWTCNQTGCTAFCFGLVTLRSSRI